MHRGLAAKFRAMWVFPSPVIGEDGTQDVGQEEVEEVDLVVGAEDDESDFDGECDSEAE